MIKSCVAITFTKLNTKINLLDSEFIITDRTLSELLYKVVLCGIKRKIQTCQKRTSRRTADGRSGESVAECCASRDDVIVSGMHHVHRSCNQLMETMLKNCFGMEGDCSEFFL